MPKRIGILDQIETGLENANGYLTLGITVTGTAGDDIIYGTDDADSLNGVGGSDQIFGLGGNDSFDGGAGNDIIFAGPIDVSTDAPGYAWINGGDGFDTVNYGGAASG